MATIQGAIEPRRVHSLNGSWHVEPESDGRKPASWKRTVPVPGLVDLAVPAYAWDAYDFHWYRRPLGGDIVPGGSERCLLVLEQAMYGTQVWINGDCVGEEIACYTSQTYDITERLRPGGENELLVRVGSRRTLPAESAVGKDQERHLFPLGIWGDVGIIVCGAAYVDLVQVIPDLKRSVAHARISIRNCQPGRMVCRLEALVRERESGVVVFVPRATSTEVAAQGTETVVVECPIPHVREWSPEDPFLYALEVRLIVENAVVDALATTFGMRTFEVHNGDFLLNGRKIFLRGGNIAFHRFLADPDRDGLPWDPAWTRKVLIDIPRAHNFNFFRNHLGHMYNRWYDVADEHGMLLQNEWQFWTTTGTPEQIRREFRRWLEDNWNHPSIVMWDPLNESSDQVVQGEIVPEMKSLDPTRPWESVDVIEEHPYIYSLGPVINTKRFGFSRSLREIEQSALPTMLNEFLWWWLDKNNEPTSLTRDVLERWLGPAPQADEIVRRQSYLAGELIELFRRIRVDAIQPFVYLSNSDGPTGHWFEGDIAACRVKPVMAAIRNAFSPFGVSIGLLDRHFTSGERREVPVHVMNDDPVLRSGLLRIGVVDANGSWSDRRERMVEVEGGGHAQVLERVSFPSVRGRYGLRAELIPGGTGQPAWSEKPVFVFDRPLASRAVRGARVAFLSASDELPVFLKELGIPASAAGDARPGDSRVLVVGEGTLSGSSRDSVRAIIGPHLEAGGTALLLEPEFGIDAWTRLPVAGELALEIEPRNDAGRGGYDSYVHPVDPSHPVWSGIEPAHLRLFNGGVGGEAVSEHHVRSTLPETPLARCGLGLGIVALSVIGVGRGRVIMCRIQMRGRLAGHGNSADPASRRVDPVLQRLMVNLLDVALGASA